MWTPATPSSTRVGAKPSLWDVPVAIWAYGMLRALAFIAPSWTEDGRIGLGVVPVFALYIFLVRGSRPAWTALVVLDILSHAMLFIAWLDAKDAPVSIPVLVGLSLLALLWPSTRQYVTSRHTVGTSAAAANEK